MDKFSVLPDEILVKILSLVPTKVAVSTSILSKRWKFLWMWLSKLDYTVSTPGLVDFINKNLPLHRAPVLESLCLDFDRLDISSENIRLWIDIAALRHVHELELSFIRKDENIFSSSLFTCKSLVTLKLTDVRIPSVACLPCLKTMKLEGDTFVDGGILQKLLSVCPVLEDLSVDLYFFNSPDIDMKMFTIIVPSLQSLSLTIPYDLFFDGYEIDTPSLKYLNLVDCNDWVHYCLISNMPKLEEAYIDVRHFILESVIRPITSVKFLTICSEGVYGDGIVFNQLEHLKVCLCDKDWSNSLGQLLNDSPNLRVLDISILEDHEDGELNDIVCWNQPSSVPECLLSSLQIFNWSRYFGRPQDRDIAVYILKNACHLKTATFKADSTEYLVSNLEMIKELALSSLASSSCQLVFVDDC